MKKKAIWLMMSCLMVASLLLASCAPAAEEEAEVTTGEEEIVVTEEEVAEEEVVVTEEEVAEEEVAEEEVVEEVPVEEVVEGVPVEVVVEEVPVEEEAEEEEAPPPMVRGAVDPDISVDVYEPDLVWAGTTLLADCHDPDRRGIEGDFFVRIIEVNMLGEIVWEYIVPEELGRHTNTGLDVELLPNDNILFVLPHNGVYEINRNGDIVWSNLDADHVPNLEGLVLNLDSKVTHDADRLPNGNTLVVYGGDEKSDAQVKEINPEGEIVWSWYAKDHFDEPPYNDIYYQGWLHTNAVTRLPNGNTLISPRNFDFIVELDPQGSVVRTIGEGVFFGQHDPEVLPNGNVLLANHGKPHRAIEFDPETGEIVWEYTVRDPDNWPVRDADRLPNGNTLITGTRTIIEVTPEGKIVWQLTLDATFDREEAAGYGFYKAERIGIQGGNDAEN